MKALLRIVGVLILIGIVVVLGLMFVPPQRTAPAAALPAAQAPDRVTDLPWRDLNGSA